MSGLSEAKEDFLNHWGVLGPQWGINRTMAQVHGLLIISPEALTTDDIMEELAISRGNAHKNLKELQSWGLIRPVIKRGDRKEYFEAEKDAMKMFQLILQERKKREIDPAMEILSDCAERTKNEKGSEAELFNKQMKDIHQVMSKCSSIINKASSSKKQFLLNLILKSLS